MGKITEARYRETVTFGNYQNVTIEMAAEIEEGEHPLDVIDNLKYIVREQIAFRTVESELAHEAEEERRELEWANRDLKNTHDNLVSSIEELKDRLRRAKEFLEKHGVNSDIDDDLPF